MNFHCFHRTIRGKPVDVSLLNSASIWKNLHGDVLKSKESAPLLKKGDQVWVSRTTETSFFFGEFFSVTFCAQTIPVRQVALLLCLTILHLSDASLP